MKFDPPSTSPPLDPQFLEEIEEALAPFRGVFSEDVIRVMREELIYGATEHSAGRALVQQRRSRPVVERSATEETPAGAVAPVIKLPVKRGGTGKR